MTKIGTLFQILYSSIKIALKAFIIFYKIMFMFLFFFIFFLIHGVKSSSEIIKIAIKSVRIFADKVYR